MNTPRSLTMPTLFPANPVWGDQRTVHYRDNTSFTIVFVTDKVAIQPYLPEGIHVSEEPAITVTYCMCRGVREMGGHGYNLVSVAVDAEYRGARDSYRGDLSLVIWESEFPPVMIGRELVGYPKLVVDIEDPWQNRESWGWRVSENGTCFLEGELWGLEKLDEAECRRLSELSRSDFDSGHLHMPYKVLAGPNYADEPVVAQVCGVVHSDEIHEAWACQGRLQWHPVTPERCFLCYGIIDSLSKLPVVRYESALITRGSHLIELGRSRALV
jgi:hypothetical protein